MSYLKNKSLIYIGRLFTFSLLIFFVSGCQKDKDLTIVKPIPSTSKTRIYYIAAEEVVWDYSPSGINAFMGKPYDPVDSVYAVNLSNGPTPRIGSKNIKAKYVEYTDATFETPKVISEEWKHLGILGPLIRANVGDSVIIYFKNKSTINTSIHVHGLLYDRTSEGSHNHGGESGSSIEPNQTYTYKYFVRDGAGPSPSQPSSIVWLYHSHVTMDESDLYAGLVGAIIITKKGVGDDNAKPSDVDREFVTLFMVFDENQSSLLPKSIEAYCPGFTNPNEEDFEESNKKHSINGLFMGNLPGLTMKMGERVRWYVLGLGNEVDLHTPHWHGNTVSINGQTTDVLELLPATMVVADMKPDNPGTWAFHCHVSDHMKAGMTALYYVE